MVGNFTKNYTRIHTRGYQSWYDANFHQLIYAYDKAKKSSLQSHEFL